MKFSDAVISYGLLLLGITILGASLPSDSYNASLPRWEWQPSGGPFSNHDEGQYLNLSSGIDLWYTVFGKKSNNTPVLILHGGTGNSNQMYHQANHLARTRTVILQDTRGQGRSPYTGFEVFHYDDFVLDAIALLDHLNYSRVAVLGWSDGAMTGLNLAMNYTSRIERVFAHGAQLNYNMSIPGLDDPIINSATGSFDADLKTNGTTYSVNSDLRKRQTTTENPYTCAKLSPLPENCAAMLKAVYAMWAREPAWDPEAMSKIKCPVWIVDGDHDRGIRRNQADALAAWTPYAAQLLLPQTGHFAQLGDPKFFNFAVEYFLDMEYDGVLPFY